MPRGSSAKREKEYEELKEEFKESGRYKGREEEVASRIVNKQRLEMGETKEAKEKDKHGKSPDRNLPIEDYDRLTVDEIEKKLDSLGKREIRRIRDYEEKHRNRKTLMEVLERRLE
jgi:hypothetical protein